VRENAWSNEVLMSQASHRRNPVCAGEVFISNCRECGLFCSVCILILRYRSNSALAQAI
jgi:hypothetical protein